jgi:hypothetical protein
MSRLLHPEVDSSPDLPTGLQLGLLGQQITLRDVF